MTTTIQPPVPGLGEQVERVLRTLPAWFGIESALQEYVADAARLPTLTALDSESGEVIGVLMLNQHFPHAAEVHVVGILPAWHRQGIGRLLQTHAEAWLRTRNVQYLQVKTVGPSSDDPNYAMTRRFYEAMGFVALEEIKTLWSERNPCLIMIKRL